MNKFLIILFCTLESLSARSIFRTDSGLPTIKVSNSKKPSQKYIQKDSHLTYDAIFALYDSQYLIKNYLPKKPIIDFENKRKQYSGKKIDKDLQKLIQEVRKGKRKFRQFTVLKNSNFNEHLKCGLLILKHKKMPFVIKLFMEHPETLVQPTSKGLEPVFFFYMGGANRHFAGFTRIKNREYIEDWAQKNDKWRGKIILPRKWFWLPKDPEWIRIEGENIRHDDKKETINIPGTYAIVADFFNYQECETYKKDRKNIIMDFCNDINMYVDPHENNFIITKNTRDPNSFALAIIDTEHFPTMVGIDTTEKISYTSHTQWIFQLAFKCLQDIYFRLKSKRLPKNRKSLT
ncbi:hypothetical protein EKK58_04580 [Candidatus Dependentiae bacterium]|nr:MAG: hypothetical protein EKK58_04580 [Candidatus Dependentiae bacterium]